MKSLEKQNNYLQLQLNHYKDRDNITGLTLTTVIAKNFGMTAQELNSFLYAKGLIYPAGQTWALYEKYQNMNLAINKYNTLYWTNVGVAVIEYILFTSGFQKTVSTDTCPF